MSDTKPVIYINSCRVCLRIIVIRRLLEVHCSRTAQVSSTISQRQCSTAYGALGATHVWYTGVIEHSHDADYTAYGIPRHNPHVIKGHAGSPYAISDYYDIDPDLAVDVPHRMEEFEALVERTHAAGMKVIIDFVPNHVARQYHSDARPAGIEDFGCGDNHEMFFAPYNNFYYITRQQFAPHIDLGQGDDAYVEFLRRHRVTIAFMPSLVSTTGMTQ